MCFLKSLEFIFLGLLEISFLIIIVKYIFLHFCLRDHLE